jgi:hypothetical protein
MEAEASGDSRRRKSAHCEVEGQKHDVKEGVGDLLLFLVGFVRGQGNELLVVFSLLLSLAGRHCGRVLECGGGQRWAGRETESSEQQCWAVGAGTGSRYLDLLAEAGRQARERRFVLRLELGGQPIDERATDTRRLGRAGRHPAWGVAGCGMGLHVGASGRQSGLPAARPVAGCRNP